MRYLFNSILLYLICRCLSLPLSFCKCIFFHLTGTMLFSHFLLRFFQNASFVVLHELFRTLSTSLDLHLKSIYFFFFSNPVSAQIISPVWKLWHVSLLYQLRSESGEGIIGQTILTCSQNCSFWLLAYPNWERTVCRVAWCRSIISTKFVILTLNLRVDLTFKCFNWVACIRWSAVNANSSLLDIIIVIRWDWLHCPVLNLRLGFWLHWKLAFSQVRICFIHLLFIS